MSSCIANRYKQFCYACILVAGLTKIMAYISGEPDYKQMLYGGVWKHVIFNPPESLTDVIQAKKHVIPFIQKRDGDTVGENVIVTCLSKIDLWYSKSDQMPLAITNFPTVGNIDEFPVSVPVTFGNTYNFQLIFRKNDSTSVIHHVTITKTLEMEEFYIYAHAFHNVVSALHKEDFGYCTNIYHRDDYSSKLTILSNLARNKRLELTSDQVCDVTGDQTGSFDMSHPSQLLDQDNDVKYEKLKFNNQEDSALLNVMTYNIWNFNTYQQNGDYYKRINSLAKVLKDANPDIVSFQEVRLETPLGGKLGPCQVDHLVSLMPHYQFVFQPAQMHKNSLEQGRTEEGLAIFSKYPIIHHDYLLLFRNQSNSADLHQRICLHAVILVPSFGKVHIFNVHLSLSHEAREMSVKQILEYLNCYDGTLTVLMGDFNAGPSEKAIKMLTNNSGLLDTWNLLHPSADGFTFSSIQNKLSKRIDYIFMKKTDTVRTQKVEVLHDKTKSNAASDHRALMATLELNNKTST